MEIKCKKLSDQRDHLQVLVSGMDDCSNQYEQRLLQIQAFQEELHSRHIKTKQMSNAVHADVPHARRCTIEQFASPRSDAPPRNARQVKML
ncbi:hypothetical protein EVAR_60302_1 [Eumeta japonica]|uniref:Uncharacterized protein n=1 Tax=Eumeta variegata TaxID=151549 RepID=A0A4C1ZKD2_EUMVA|nr:hypothetical protein EVAR_60302_1 [Eumeta japonica]